MERTFTLDPSATPKAMDLTGDGRTEAVYERDGDTLRICFRAAVARGGEAVRPDEVKADHQKFFLVITLERVKDDKKGEKKDK